MAKDQFGFGLEKPTFRMQKSSMEEAIKNTSKQLDKLYSDGEINQDEYKYLYESIEELKSQSDFYEKRDATFSILKGSNEKAGDPRYKLMIMHDKEERFPKISEIKKDFGDEYGSDLSMWVMEHYKDTGEYIKPENITDETIFKLKNKYSNY